jgi:hypothetical protein
MMGFTVVYRDYGHWDIYQNNERIYRIRGVPGAYLVLGERSKWNNNGSFKTVQECMACITGELMFELIVTEGIEPTDIGS